MLLQGQNCNTDTGQWYVTMNTIDNYNDTGEWCLILKYNG